MSNKVVVIGSVCFGLFLLLIVGMLGFISCDPRTINHGGYAVLGLVVGSIGFISLIMGPMLPTMWDD